jgi:outer membrane protein assembly factor BamB
MLLPLQSSASVWRFRGDNHSTAVYDRDVPDNNALLWTFPTGDQVQSSPVYHGKKVFFGSDDGLVYAVDANMGTEIWRFDTGEAVMASPTISDSGELFIGSSDFSLHVLDLDTGKDLWDFELPGGYGQVISSAAVDDERVYFGATDHIVYGVNLTTHEEDWSFSTENEVWSSPALWDDKVYIGSLDGQMYCLWADNGTLVWNHSTTSYEGVYSSPAISDGKVVFGSALDDKAVYALDARTGELEWRFQLPGPSYGSAAVHDGVVYIPGWGPPGKLYALPLEDPTPGDGVLDDGDVIWSSVIEDEQGGSSAVYSEGKVLIGSDFLMGDEGRLFCFNATNGKEIWNFSAGGDVYSSPGLGEGVVYVGSNDGRVYAIGGDPGAKMEVKVFPESEEVQGGRVIGVNFLVTYRGLPLEGAYIKFHSTDGELSQTGASTFPDGTQRIKFEAPKVKAKKTVTFSAEATFFGLDSAFGSANISIVPASEYQVKSTDAFPVMKYAPYFGLMIFLIVANVAVVALNRKKGGA